MAWPPRRGREGSEGSWAGGAEARCEAWPVLPTFVYEFGVTGVCLNVGSSVGEVVAFSGLDAGEQRN